MAKAVEAKPSSEDKTGSADAPLSRAQQWLWRGALAATVVVLIGLVTAAVVVLGNSATKTGAGSAGPSSSASATTSLGPSPSDSFVVEPGSYGQPSLSGTDPADPWDGAQPIDTITVDGFKEALGDKWELDFSTKPLLGGIMEMGLAGDTSRAQRRLDAIVEYNNSNIVYEVMCAAGGSEVTPTDDTSMSFIEDCLATTALDEDWTILKNWLDENLRSMAGEMGDTWVDLSTMRMYAESNSHVISCTLTNS